MRDAILDGDIVVMSEAGPKFNEMMMNREPASYVAFDLLWLSGRDLRELPLWRRKRALEKLVASCDVSSRCSVLGVAHPGDFGESVSANKQRAEGGPGGHTQECSTHAEESSATGEARSRGRVDRGGSKPRSRGERA